MGIAVTRESQKYVANVGQELKIITHDRVVDGPIRTVLPHQLDVLPKANTSQSLEERPKLQLTLAGMSFDQLSNNYRASQNFLRFTLDKMSTFNNSDGVETERELDQ